jgi:methionyl-tRNA formyltransferase
MNITLLANRDLASNLALNQLLPRLSEQHQLRVFLSSQVGSAANLPEPLRLLKFFEQTLFNDILFPALDGAGRILHPVVLPNWHSSPCRPSPC